jgi:hypothetical protein
MRESANPAGDPSALRRLCDSMHVTLAARFTPARSSFPGRINRPWCRAFRYAACVAVWSSGMSSHATARAMIAQYRLALLATDWQAAVIDAPQKMPLLHCNLINNVMSNKGVPCPI